VERTNIRFLVVEPPVERMLPERNDDTTQAEYVWRPVRRSTLVEVTLANMVAALKLLQDPFPEFLGIFSRRSLPFLSPSQ